MPTKAEKQKLFNTSVSRLQKQGKFSVDKDLKTCLYRAPDGSRCGVGLLITNKEYKPMMENNSVSALRNMKLLPKRLVPFIEILRELQSAHDYAASVWDKKSGWELTMLKKLHYIAKEFKLDDSKIPTKFDYTGNKPVA